MTSRFFRAGLVLAGVLALAGVARALTLEWDVSGSYTIYRGVHGPIGVRNYVWLANVEHPTATYTDNAVPVCTGAPCRKIPRYSYVVQGLSAVTGGVTGHSNAEIAGQLLPGWMSAEVHLMQVGVPVKVRWVGLQGTASTDSITFHVAYDSPDTIVSSMAVTNAACTGGGAGTGECVFSLPGTISGWGPWDFRYRQENGDILAASQAVYLQQ
jgi:hypothetical protein